MKERLIFTIFLVTLLSLSACGKETSGTETIEYANTETGLYGTLIAQDNTFYELISNNPIDSTFVWDGGAESTARISKAVEYRDLWNAEIEYALAVLKEYLTAEDYKTLERAYEGWKQYMENTMSVEQNMFYAGMSYGIGSNDTYPLVMEAVAERTKNYALELMALEYAFTGTVEFAAAD